MAVVIEVVVVAAAAAAAHSTHSFHAANLGIHQLCALLSETTV